MKEIFKKMRPFIIPIIVTLCVVLLFHYIFMFGYVPTASMEPTLKTGSVILGLRLFNELETGDIIIFHHEDDADGDIWVAIVGKNQSGFTLAFVKDQETVIDADFRAGAQDDSGTLITYIEEDATVTQ